ncbi:MAG: type II toxin-antitoxin system VapB family antitoxin [Fimbriimonas ginsengisoli]|uniref:Type II toxin-antitoxin system VapB family antitoxin n=1 Tax=Fimbriimonas ginsengisoli TaxID=1005039 RepID=A0A931LTQ8_FIMGI|nr:type II toxin-antitoxin system VapB family antitoxin [Fimbriimonas ginsengisoli]
MAMNIKNAEAQRLAQELAGLTGESLTGTIVESLRERLDRVHAQRRGGMAERLLAIGRDCASRMKKPLRSADIDEILYDERGLPR